MTYLMLSKAQYLDEHLCVKLIHINYEYARSVRTHGALDLAVI